MYGNDVGKCSSPSLAQTLLYKKFMPFYKALSSSATEPIPQFPDL